MIANLKARAVLGARDAVFVIGVKEGILGDVVSRHEVEECFWMGFPSHSERTVARRKRTARRRGQDRMLQLENSQPPYYKTQAGLNTRRAGTKAAAYALVDWPTILAVIRALRFCQIQLGQLVYVVVRGAHHTRARTR